MIYIREANAAASHKYLSEMANEIETEIKTEKVIDDEIKHYLNNIYFIKMLKRKGLYSSIRGLKPQAKPALEIGVLNGRVNCCDSQRCARHPNFQNLYS